MRKLLENLVHGPLEAARRELARRQEQFAALDSKLAAKREELRRAEGGAGAQLLEDGPTDGAVRKLGGQIANLRAETHVLESAAAMARQQIIAAEHDIRKAEVEGLL